MLSEATWNSELASTGFPFERASVATTVPSSISMKTTSPRVSRSIIAFAATAKSAGREDSAIGSRSQPDS